MHDIENWLKNIQERKANKEVVILKNTSSSEIPLRNLSSTLRFDVVELGKTEYSPTTNSTRNIILVIKEVYVNDVQARLIYRSICNVLYKKPMIIIKDQHSIKKMIDQLLEKNYDNASTIQYEVIHKTDLKEWLELDYLTLRQCVKEHAARLKSLCSYFEENEATKEVYFSYYQKKILIVTFAQYLYRLANMDFISTTKFVGTELWKLFGVKSKTRRLNISNPMGKIQSPSDMHKNYRTFDLNQCQIEIDIREDIAKKLFRLNIKQLDVSTVASVLELPLETTEGIYLECNLK